MWYVTKESYNKVMIKANVNTDATGRQGVMVKFGDEYVLVQLETVGGGSSYKISWNDDGGYSSWGTGVKNITGTWDAFIDPLSSKTLDRKRIAFARNDVIERDRSVRHRARIGMHTVGKRCRQAGFGERNQTRRRRNRHADAIGIVLVDRSQMAAATVSPCVVVFPPRSVGQAKVHIARLVGKVQADVFVSTVAERYIHAERNLPAVHNFIEILFRQAHFSQNPSVARDRSVDRHIFPRVTGRRIVLYSQLQCVDGLSFRLLCNKPRRRDPCQGNGARRYPWAIPNASASVLP